MSEHPLPPLIELGAALRALPAPMPERSEWQRMQAALQARPTRRRVRVWPIALAACLALLALLPGWLARTDRILPSAPDATDVALATTAGESGELTRLREESARLDALLRVAYDQGVLNAQDAALSAQIVDRVQWIDAALGTDASPAAQRALWQERVLLLRQLTSIDNRSPWLAASGHGRDAVPILL